MAARAKSASVDRGQSSQPASGAVPGCRPHTGTGPGTGFPPLPPKPRRVTSQAEINEAHRLWEIVEDRQCLCNDAWCRHIHAMDRSQIGGQCASWRRRRLVASPRRTRAPSSQQLGILLWCIFFRRTLSRASPALFVETRRAACAGASRMDVEKTGVGG